MAKLKMIQEDEAKERRQFGYQSQLQSQRDIAAENRLLLKESLSAGKKEDLAAQKKKQAFVVAKTFMNQFEDYIDKLDTAGFLPKDSGVYEHTRASTKQGHPMIPGISEPNAELWRGWLELQGNMIGFARSVQNDIGPRAMAAFAQAVRVSEKPPTKDGNRRSPGAPGSAIGNSPTASR
jgi:hypothetical protein